MRHHFATSKVTNYDESLNMIYAHSSYEFQYEQLLDYGTQGSLKIVKKFKNWYSSVSDFFLMRSTFGIWRNPSQIPIRVWYPADMTGIHARKTGKHTPATDSRIIGEFNNALTKDPAWVEFEKAFPPMALHIRTSSSWFFTCHNMTNNEQFEKWIRSKENEVVQDTSFSTILGALIYQTVCNSFKRINICSTLNRWNLALEADIAEMQRDLFRPPGYMEECAKEFIENKSEGNLVEWHERDHFQVIPEWPSTISRYPIPPVLNKFVEEMKIKYDGELVEYEQIPEPSPKPNAICPLMMSCGVPYASTPGFQQTIHSVLTRFGAPCKDTPKQESWDAACADKSFVTFSNELAKRADVAFNEFDWSDKVAAIEDISPANKTLYLDTVEKWYRGHHEKRNGISHKNDETLGLKTVDGTTYTKSRCINSLDPIIPALLLPYTQRIMKNYVKLSKEWVFKGHSSKYCIIIVYGENWKESITEQLEAHNDLDYCVFIHGDDFVIYDYADNVWHEGDASMFEATQRKIALTKYQEFIIMIAPHMNEDEMEMLLSCGFGLQIIGHGKNLATIVFPGIGSSGAPDTTLRNCFMTMMAIIRAFQLRQGSFSHRLITAYSELGFTLKYKYSHKYPTFLGGWIVESDNQWIWSPDPVRTILKNGKMMSDPKMLSKKCNYHPDQIKQLVLRSQALSLQQYDHYPLIRAFCEQALNLSTSVQRIKDYKTKQEDKNLIIGESIGYHIPYTTVLDQMIQRYNITETEVFEVEKLYRKCPLGGVIFNSTLASWGNLLFVEE